MSELYPLTFLPIYKDKIWGGQKIKTELGKDTGSLPNCGETWEISGVDGNISKVADGPLQGHDLKSLIGRYGAQLLGEKIHARFGDDFPLLIKFIDANQDLSIQVHPDDTLAKSRHNSFGKTEMWYVMQADEGATLISGFNQPLDRTKYLDYFNTGRLTELLNREQVSAHDVFFLPAGRVHTIGKGLLIAEIQQTSDITYRIYDFDRKDEQGNSRELHTEEALDAIDYNQYDQYKTPYSDQLNERVPLVNCTYFTTNKLWFDRTFVADRADLDSFKIYICLQGTVRISTGNGEVPIKKGEVALVPASIKHFTLETSGPAIVLESYIEG
ncbi:MAG: mannose-6-phosphate isomerase [Cyclobacteriaceae bacterium]|nr:mannose-6-phosphate isomerase [Cyclobacteriaceae bacterium]